MSIFDNLESMKRTIDDILENKESYVLIDRKNEKLNRFVNTRFSNVYYDQDERECITTEATFKHWLHFLGFEYCDDSCFEKIGDIVIIREEEDRITKIFDVFEEIVNEQGKTEESA